MVNLKKYNVLLQHFVLFLTFTLFLSCSQQKFYVSKIEGKQIGVTTAQLQKPEIEDFIKPYRENIDKDLNTILAYCTETLDKSKGEWQTNIGNLLADVTLQKSNLIFEKREKKPISFCLLNHGGIRAMIPKGDVTTRAAFEVMPFENSAVVIALHAAQINEIAQYIIKEKKPHPLAGMTFTISKNGNPENILIQGQPLTNNTIYYVVTSDYLANGGDNMVFFKNSSQRFDLDYKLRNILIDYFKEVDTIPLIANKRIIVE